MGRTSPDYPDWYHFRSTTWSPSVSSRKRVVEAVRCFVRVESFEPLGGLWEVSRSGPSVFGWRLDVHKLFPSFSFRSSCSSFCFSPTLTYACGDIESQRAQ